MRSASNRKWFTKLDKPTSDYLNRIVLSIGVPREQFVRTALVKYTQDLVKRANERAAAQLEGATNGQSQSAVPETVASDGGPSDVPSDTVQG